MIDTDSQLLWDVDFSLALHNRTGKYHIGRDILASCSDLIGDVFYWRIKRSKPPTGMAARIIGKAAAWEARLQDLVPSIQPIRRRLHLDPLTVLSTRIGPKDAVLCHDLGPLTHPDLFPAKVPELYEKAYWQINRAQPKIVFVSRASRDRFADLYGVPQDATVIYPQIRIGSISDDSQPVLGVQKPFFLTVGSIGTRKNQICAMKAFVETGLSQKGWSYVVCGAHEPGFEEALTYAHTREDIHVLPFVDDAQLAWLYANAAAFVLTSKLEGFGMPVAEAMAHGLVPIISTNSVLEEVAGSDGISVNETDISSISAGMFQASRFRPDKKFEVERNLKQRAKSFTREKFEAEWRDFLQNNDARSETVEC